MTLIKAQYLLLVGSVIALAIAYISQYQYGHHPCELCYWQRYGYMAVVLFSVLSILQNGCPISGTISIAALGITCGMALFHFGIEQKWWEGFTTCTLKIDEDLSIAKIKEFLANAPSVRCDEPTWFLFGLSMAGWNVLYSGAYCVSLGTYMSKVYLIGAGPGDPELLTLKAAKILQAADAVVYDNLIDAKVLKLIPKTAKKILQVNQNPNTHSSRMRSMIC